MLVSIVSANIEYMKNNLKIIQCLVYVYLGVSFYNLCCVQHFTALCNLRNYIFMFSYNMWFE